MDTEGYFILPSTKIRVLPTKELLTKKLLSRTFTFYPQFLQLVTTTTYKYMKDRYKRTSKNGLLLLPLIATAMTDLKMIREMRENQ